MDDLAERFHAACDARFTSGRRRNSYPDDIKELAVAYALQARRAGLRWSKVGARLGISSNTVKTWSEGTAPAPKKEPKPIAADTERVRPVVIQEAAAPTTSCRYVVRAANTLRIECKTAADVAALIRALA